MAAERDIDKWEAQFRADLESGSPDGGAPDPLVERIAGSLRPGRALDLACGAGANAVWLAARGWRVTAVDRSPSAIELVRRHAGARGVLAQTHATRTHIVDMHVADLEAHEYEIAPESWDLIVMCRYLQRDLFEPAIRGLAPGGVLIVIALLAEPKRFPHDGRFRVLPGELAACFSSFAGCSILRSYEGPHDSGESRREASRAPESAGEAEPRGHLVAEIVVRRGSNP